MPMPELPEEEVSTPAPPSIPYSKEAEEAVVGALEVAGDEIYPSIKAIVSPEDFYIHRLRWIMEAVGSLYAKRTPIDLLTITEVLDSKGQLAEIGGPAYLTALLNRVPSTLNSESYARIVKAHAIRRAIINTGNSFATSAFNESMGIDAVLSTCETAWEKVRCGSERGNNLMTMPTILSKAYERLDAISEKKRPPGFATMLVDLDHILHGLRRSKVYLVAAKPGDGKTAFLLTVARNLMKYEHKKVLFFSIEMQEHADEDPISGGELSERLIGMEAGIDTTHISDGRLLDSEYPLFTHAIECMDGWKFTVDDSVDLNPDQMLARALKVKEEQGLDVIMIDYIQIADTPPGMKFGTREQEVSYLSREIKSLAKKLDVAVLVAAQVSRAYASRGDGRLQLSDLRESGALEANANAVIFIQPTSEDAKPSDLEEKVVDVAKNRGGKIGTCNLQYAKLYTEFRNLYRKQEGHYWWEGNNGNNSS